MSKISFHCSHRETQLYAVRIYNILFAKLQRGKNTSSKKVQKAKAKHLSNSVIITYKPIKI